MISRIIFVFCFILTIELVSSYDDLFLLSEDLYSGKFGLNKLSIIDQDEDPIKASRELINDWVKQDNIPGVVAAVSVGGKQVWSSGFGYSDLENQVETDAETHWRVASISKSLTTSLIGKLLEAGKLNWETPIYEYLPPSVFPIKTWNGNKVNITLKQVMSHIAGLRETIIPTDYEEVYYDRKNVTEVVMQFKDEALHSEPGTKFAYSNYGFQIVGAIIESVMNETYESAINKIFKQIGLHETFPERPEKLYFKRARYYTHVNDTKIVQNKVIWDDLWSFNKWWPAGGIMSTAGDLLKYGNVMIDSSKGRANSFLKASTVKQLWTPNVKFSNDSNYAEGWIRTNLSMPLKCTKKGCKTPPIKYYMNHSGGLSGLTTYLALFPEQDIVVSVLTNVGMELGIVKVAVLLAKFFMNW